MGLANADQSVSRELIEFHRAQAKGGAAIVTVGESAIDKDRSINQAGQINLGDERIIPGLSNLAEAIKRNGALASIQLQHAGRMAIRELERRKESRSAPPVRSASSPKTGAGARSRSKK